MEGEVWTEVLVGLVGGVSDGSMTVVVGGVVVGWVVAGGWVVVVGGGSVVVGGMLQSKPAIEHILLISSFFLSNQSTGSSHPKASHTSSFISVCQLPSKMSDHVFKHMMKL